MSEGVPTVADLRRAATVFRGFVNVDAAWLRVRADIAAEGGARSVPGADPGWDLSAAGHRTALLRLLNAWGCRIRYPRPGEPDPFDGAAAAWWRTWSAALPAGELADLSEAAVDAVAAAFGQLCAVPVSSTPRRTLGPTAAAKALYALRPRAVMPWDAAIAQARHGARDAEAFGRHQRLGRGWARAVLAESGLAAAELPAALGRPAVSLAKVLDEYLYVTVTLAGPGGPDRRA